jgi:hypothetical protein
MRTESLQLPSLHNRASNGEKASHRGLTGVASANQFTLAKLPPDALFDLATLSKLLFLSHPLLNTLVLARFRPD